MVDPTGAPARFSATEAALTGVRLMRRAPGVAATWAALYFVYLLLTGAASVAIAGPALSALAAQSSAGAAADPGAVLAAAARVLPFAAAALAVGLVFYAVMLAAVNRAVLRPEAVGPRGVAFGADELRQGVLLALLTLVLVAAYVAVVLVAILLGALLRFTLTAGQPGGATNPGPATAGLVALVVVAAMATLVTRLSLASALTFDTGRVDLFGSWRLTRGIGGRLFGGYLVAWVLLVALFFAVQVLFNAAMLAAGGLAATASVFKPDMTSLATYYTPPMILWTGLMAVLSAVGLAVLAGAPAGAYAQLRGLDAVRPEGGARSDRPLPRADLPRFGR